MAAITKKKRKRRGREKEGERGREERRKKRKRTQHQLADSNRVSSACLNVVTISFSLLPNTCKIMNISLSV